MQTALREAQGTDAISSIVKFCRPHLYILGVSSTEAKSINQSINHQYSRFSAMTWVLFYRMCIFKKLVQGLYTSSGLKHINNNLTPWCIIIY